MAITRGLGGACIEESQKFGCVSHGSFGDDRRRWRIICRNPALTRPTRWQWEVCRLIAGKGEVPTPESFLAFREPPAGRSNRVTPGIPLRWDCDFLVKMTEFGAAPKCNRFVRGVSGTGTADGASPLYATDGIQVHVSSTGQECCLVQ
jgi:hypothetical protein